MKEKVKPKDDRPARYGWAPGDYHNRCTSCKHLFTGHKCAHTCADCAYSDGGV